MRFMEIADAEDQLALWRLISDNVWSAVMAQAKEQARQKVQAVPRPKKAKPQRNVPKSPTPPKPKIPTPKPPPAKSPVPKQAKAVPPPAQHHCPAHSPCSGQPTPAVSAKPIFMGCSRRTWPTRQLHRYPIRIFDAKSWGFSQKYGCFRKSGSR